MMAELPILSLKRAEITAINRRVKAGDIEAQAQVQHLFDPYPRPLECFTCAAEIDGHPAIMFLPEKKEFEWMMAVPICLECHELPPLMRWAKALKILRKMWPGVHFNFVPPR